jgi:LPXTG-site transpeptidase (sortase) family protein
MEILNKNNSNFKYTVNWSFFLKSRLYTLLFIVGGVGLLGTQLLLPLILIETGNTNNVALEKSVLGASTGFSEVSFDELKDKGMQYTPPLRENVPEFFNLKVDKLKISKGVIETNSFNMNPDKYLGHYAGTALPGEVGNVFIYGHSVVPFFFNPDNYKTIFSTLHKLENEDVIEVEYNGKTFKYKVFEKKVLSPEEVNPLATITPAYLNEKTLSLMTCTPPGTTLKRLIVGAKQIEE